MKDIKLYRDWLSESVQHKLKLDIIKALHEGVRMIEVSTINEGSVDRAQLELDRLIKGTNGTPIISEFVPEVMALVKKFADSGQSGGSAPYTTAVILQVLGKLLRQEPLGGIMCTDDEWSDLSQWGDKGSYQNNRLSSVFKEVGGKPYYLNAIVFKPVGKDYTFTGSAELPNGEVIGSSHYIKELPFEPKTFVIDVTETEFRKMKDGSLVPEVGGGWWESKIANPEQLESVWEYYDKKERK